MASQMYATTGRRPRPGTVASINAQTPYLPAQFQQNYQNQYQRDVYGQTDRQLALERELGERGLGIQESGLEIQGELLDLEKAKLEQAFYDMDERRRLQEEQIAFAADKMKAEEAQAKKARLLGLGQLGVTAYLGNEKNNALASANNPLLDNARKVGDFSQKAAMDDVAAGKTMAGQDLWGKEGMELAATSNKGGEIASMQSQYPVEDMASVANWSTDTFTSPSKAWGSVKKNYMPILGGGLAGGTVGASLGESYMPWGGKKERRAMGGALGGGLASYYFSGGDPWSTTLGALLGGGLSFSGLGKMF